MITDAYFFGIINQEYLTGFDILDLQIDERRVFNMFSDVELRLKKRRKILFSAESESLERLSSLISVQNRRTLVMWALDCAGQTLKHFEERYPDEKRPGKCLEICGAWARGEIKMPVAKRAELDAHAAARDIEDSEYSALCHAIGHAGATVHSGKHAIGLPLYELSAIVYRYGKDDFADPVTEKINYYCERLIYWQENADLHELEWADFLTRDKA